MLMIVSGCGQNNKQPEKKEGLHITTTFYPIYIATLNVVDGVDGVEVEQIASNHTGCMHDYQLKPKDVVAMKEADLLVANGAGMEQFIEDTLKENDIDCIYLTDAHGLIKNEEHEEEHEHEEEEGHQHEEGEYNPHGFMNLSYYQKEVEYLAQELGKKDPKNKEKYEENAKNYIEKVEEIKKEMEETFSQENTSKKIIILHDAFFYFAEEFNLEVVDSLEVESDSGLSAKQIQELINRTKASKAQMILAEKQYSSQVADTISKATDCEVYILDSCVTGEDDKDSYLNAMKSNLEMFKKALAK